VLKQDFVKDAFFFDRIDGMLKYGGWTLIFRYVESSLPRSSLLLVEQIMRRASRAAAGITQVAKTRSNITSGASICNQDILCTE
jgi:hypothetical protein